MSSKKKSLRAAEQDRPDVKVQRDAWREQTAGVDVCRLVFLDESGAKTNMTRLYGRSFDGQRVVGAAPHGHWRTTTMLAAMRIDGSTAPMVGDRRANGRGGIRGLCGAGSGRQPSAG